MKITSQIETLNKPNLNGRIYTSECIEKCIADVKTKIDDRRFLVKLAGSENVVGLGTKLEIVGDKLNAEIEILDTPTGKLVKEMSENSDLQFSMSGTGKVIDGVVIDYSMEYINCDYSHP